MTTSAVEYRLFERINLRSSAPHVELRNKDRKLIAAFPEYESAVSWIKALGDKTCTYVIELWFNGGRIEPAYCSGMMDVVFGARTFLTKWCWSSERKWYQSSYVHPSEALSVEHEPRHGHRSRRSRSRERKDHGDRHGEDKDKRHSSSLSASSSSSSSSSSSPSRDSLILAGTKHARQVTVVEDESIERASKRLKSRS